MVYPQFIYSQPYLISAPIKNGSSVSDGAGYGNPASWASSENTIHQVGFSLNEQDELDYLHYLGAGFLGIWNFVYQDPTQAWGIDNIFAKGYKNHFFGITSKSIYIHNRWRFTNDFGWQWETMKRIKIGLHTQDLLSNYPQKDNRTVAEIGFKPILIHHEYSPIISTIKVSTPTEEFLENSNTNIYMGGAVFPFPNISIQGEYSVYSKSPQWHLGLNYHMGRGQTFAYTSEDSRIKGNHKHFTFQVQKKPYVNQPPSRGQYAVYSLNLKVLEKEEPSHFFSPPSGKSLEQVISEIEDLGKNPYIQGIIIHAGYFSSSWANCEEIRRSILDVAKEKKVVFYLSQTSNLNYYLATSGNKIIAPAQSLFHLSGFSQEIPFIKGTLSKLGIEAQFVKSGKYKSFPEIFSNDSISPEYKQNSQNLLNDMHRSFVSSISLSRKISIDSLEKYFSKPTLTVDEAQQYGFIDSTLYPDQIAPLYFGKNAKATPILYPPFAKSSWSGKKQVAILRLEGDILDGEENQRGMLTESSITSGPVGRTLSSIAKSPDIQALIIRINSGGGSALASDYIRYHLNLVKQKMPVIISVGGVCASGAYYISSLGDSLIAESTSIVGSIGVFGGKFVTKNLFEKIGAHKEVIKTSPYADGESSYRKWNESELIQVQKYMDVFYAHFTKLVMDDRKLDSNKIKEVAEGRVFTGKQSVELNLFDSNGGMKEAKLAAAKKIKTPIYNIEWVDYTNIPTPLDELTSDIQANIQAIKSPFSKLFNPILNPKFEVWAWSPESWLLGE